VGVDLLGDDFPMLSLSIGRITHRNIDSFPVEKQGVLYPDKRGVNALLLLRFDA